MDILPIELENIVNEYKQELETEDKRKILNMQFKNEIKIQNCNYFSKIVKGENDIYYYYSNYFHKLIILKNPKDYKGINDNSIITYLK